MSMQKITECCFIIPGRTNVGVITSGKECILIDTGLDKNDGKRILKELENSSISVKVIINTHSHADHCGANKYIQEKTSCKIYAPSIESAFIENPILEPTAFFSGAAPIKELQNKFIFAEESKVDEELKPGKIVILEKELEIIPLNGHSINQTGIAFNNTLFCGDSLFSKEVLEKHKIPFFANITQTKKTLEYLSNAQFKFFIPSHTNPNAHIKPLVMENLKQINKCEEIILKILKEPKNIGFLIKEFCALEGLTIKSIQQQALLKTSIYAYLTHLQEKNKANASIVENTLIWKAN